MPHLNERLRMPLSAAPVAGAAMIDVLAKVPLFAGLARGELERLAAMTIERNYKRNVIVVNEGDRADALYFVLLGRIKVFAAGEDGRDVVLSKQGAGTYFGDMMLDDGVRSASVMTLEPCRLATLSRDVFHDFLMHHPDTALALIKSLIRRIRLMNDRVRDLSMLDVSGRVAKLLLSLAREVDGRLMVEERLTQEEIGEQVGASREMVSRVFKALKADNYIRTEGRRIVILRKSPQG
jgi:CRP/FNR family transcriptional regulator, cyclic AMP receptor protein